MLFSEKLARDRVVKSVLDRDEFDAYVNRQIEIASQTGVGGDTASAFEHMWAPIQAGLTIADAGDGPIQWLAAHGFLYWQNSGSSFNLVNDENLYFSIKSASGFDIEKQNQFKVVAKFKDQKSATIPFAKCKTAPAYEGHSTFCLDYLSLAKSAARLSVSSKASEIIAIQIVGCTASTKEAHFGNKACSMDANQARDLIRSANMTLNLGVPTIEHKKYTVLERAYRLIVPAPF